MKLKCFFSANQSFIVEWDKPYATLAQDFPTYVILDGDYYEFGMYSEIYNMPWDVSLHFGKIMQSALPYDMFGNQFPVVDFREKFNLILPTGKICECGAKHTDFPDSHMLFCPLWKKFEVTNGND